jgi:hypothetical protein
MMPATLENMLSPETERFYTNSNCPKCGSDEVRRSMRRGWVDKLMDKLGLYPYRCTNYLCGKRFYHYKTMTKKSLLPASDPVDLVMAEPEVIAPVQTSKSPPPIADRQPSQTIVPPERKNRVRGDTLQLYWQDEGSDRVKSIAAIDIYGRPTVVRLGRNPKLCDVIFSSLTVSGTHVEIYFDRTEDAFWLHNLRSSNPPQVDGKTITDRILLQPGMLIALGKQEIAIDICNVEPEIAPTLLKF